MKEFNTTGLCVPDMHYMVDIQSKLDAIIEKVEKGKYFTINRSRQYGKTTTMLMLKKRLKDKYEIINISFEGVGDGPFLSNISFVKNFIEMCSEKMKFTNISDSDISDWETLENINEENAFRWLGRKITLLCEKYEIILMVDEMDKCSDNQVFLNFLGMLRDKYQSRNAGEDFTFKSVILAGVYDVKNLKIKLHPDEERKYNSPWNIAVDFNVDMSFHPEEIATMLEAYEEDTHTGMDIQRVSEELYHYTSGYPYLVSWLCKWIEEQGERNWTSEGLRKAVKEYYNADSTLKDDLIKNYENNKALNELIDDMLLRGGEYSFVSTDEAVSIGKILGIFKKSEDEDNRLMISNIIFENVLTEHILNKWC